MGLYEGGMATETPRPRPGARVRPGISAESGVRARRAAERRAAIIAAALDLFSERGFAAARIEDVAARAGVAKGTVYLNFADKEALFEGIVRAQIGPLLSAVAWIDVDALPSVRAVVEEIGVPAICGLIASRRADVMRLLIAEGRRFPRLAQFYHAEIITPGIALLRRLLRRAEALGELSGPDLNKYPQLVAAPVVMAVIWEGLFQHIEPLDLEGLLRTHLQVIFGPPGGQSSV